MTAILAGIEFDEPALDVCECNHFRGNHSIDQRCLIANCKCEYFVTNEANQKKRHPER